MSDGITISALPLAKSLSLASAIPVVSEGTTERATIQDIIDLTSPEKAFLRGTSSGNWSFGYSDNTSAANSCGKLGAGVYWKTTVTLSNSATGGLGTPLRLWLQELPCDEAGEIVPYQIFSEYTTVVNSSAKQTVAIWLICTTAPTHMINFKTKDISEVLRSADSTATGLPSYPIGIAKEFKYSLEYTYFG